LEDKGEDGGFRKYRVVTEKSGIGLGGELQIPPLRFAPVGMTRGVGLLYARFATGMGGVEKRSLCNHRTLFARSTVSGTVLHFAEKV
jgi:hypothetical protein